MSSNIDLVYYTVLDYGYNKQWMLIFTNLNKDILKIQIILN